MRYISYHAWAIVFIPPWGWLAYDLTMGQPKSSPISPFAGITSAPVYSTDTIQLLNITKSDWVGKAREYLQHIKELHLLIYEEDELKPILLETTIIDIASEWFPIVALVVIVLTFLGAVGVELAFRRHSTRKSEF
jgi:hypothetical protein